MKYFVHFLVSVFCYAIVSGSNRPLESDSVRLVTRDDGINYRLPNNTIPETYDITLYTDVDEEQFNFTGRVSIKLRALEATNQISLHHRQLTITSVELTVAVTNAPISLGEHSYNVATEIVTFPTKTQLTKDQSYILTIKYTGILRGENGVDLKGFYRSSYKDSAGITRQFPFFKWPQRNSREID